MEKYFAGEKVIARLGKTEIHGKMARTIGAPSVCYSIIPDGARAVNNLSVIDGWIIERVKPSVEEIFTLLDVGTVFTTINGFGFDSGRMIKTSETEVIRVGGTSAFKLMNHAVGRNAVALEVQ